MQAAFPSRRHDTGAPPGPVFVSCADSRFLEMPSCDESVRNLVRGSSAGACRIRGTDKACELRESGLAKRQLASASQIHLEQARENLIVFQRERPAVGLMHGSHLEKVLAEVRRPRQSQAAPSWTRGCARQTPGKENPSWSARPRQYDGKTCLTG